MKIVKDDGTEINVAETERESIWHGLWAAYAKTLAYARNARASGYSSADKTLTAKLERLEGLADFMG